MFSAANIPRIAWFVLIVAACAVATIVLARWTPHLTAMGVINAFMAATLIGQTLAAVRSHDQQRLQFLKWRLWPMFAFLLAVQALVTWGPHLGH